MLRETIKRKTDTDPPITATKSPPALIQIYTGLVYRGPELIREILEALKP